MIGVNGTSEFCKIWYLKDGTGLHSGCDKWQFAEFCTNITAIIPLLFLLYINVTPQKNKHQKNMVKIEERSFKSMCNPAEHTGPVKPAVKPIGIQII